MSDLVEAVRDLANRQAGLATRLRAVCKTPALEAEADILMDEAARLETLATDIAAGNIK